MFAKFQKKLHDLVGLHQPILLAVSGGVDSMVMLHLFSKSDYKIAVAHCDFQLRKSSHREAELIKAYCESKRIPFHSQLFDTKSKVKASTESTQMVARQLRYDFFYEICNQYHYQLIATAHHANDNIETILLNVIKGTGIRGMVGIAEKTEDLIRPLLTFTKQEIIDYADQHQIEYIEDTSNTSNEYQRNFIRNKVIPLLKEINPQVEQASLRSVENLQFAYQLFSERLQSIKTKLIHKKGNYQMIYKRQLFARQFPRQILFELLTDYGFAKHQIDHLFELLNQNKCKPSEIYYSSTHSIVIDSRERLILSPLDTVRTALFDINTDCESVVFGNQKIVVLPTELPETFTQPPTTIYVDADQLTFPIHLRKWVPGDYFYPFGLGKKQKIAKYLTNEKVDKISKEKQYVLTSGNHIVWLVGRRMDDRFKITNNTENVLKFSLEQL